MKWAVGLILCLMAALVTQAYGAELLVQWSGHKENATFEQGEVIDIRPDGAGWAAGTEYGVPHRIILRVHGATVPMVDYMRSSYGNTNNRRYKIALVSGPVLDALNVEANVYSIDFTTFQTVTEQR